MVKPPHKAKEKRGKKKKKKKKKKKVEAGQTTPVAHGGGLDTP
jgi:hypothetical protein